MSAGDKEIAFEAFVGGAIDYCRAADALLELRNTAGISPSPIYNTYFHAAELALKGFLRHAGKSTSSLKAKWSHDLSGLYSEAIACDLQPDWTGKINLGNVIDLLHDGNKMQGFRYFNHDPTVRPDLGWAAKEVNNLIDLVKKRTGYSHGVPGPPAKMEMVIGEPVPLSPITTDDMDTRKE